MDGLGSRMPGRAQLGQEVAVEAVVAGHAPGQHDADGEHEEDRVGRTIVELVGAVAGLSAFIATITLEALTWAATTLEIDAVRMRRNLTAGPTEDELAAAGRTVDRGLATWAEAVRP